MTNKKPHTDSSGNGARQTQRADPRPTYFLSVSLTDVRCFTEEQTLDLSDGRGRPARWTILLGNNGTGKTTALQALAFLAERTAVELRQIGAPGAEAKSKRTMRKVALKDVEDQFFRGWGASGKINATVVSGPLMDGERAGRQPQSITLDKKGSAEYPGIWHSEFSYPNDCPVCYGYGTSRRLGKGALGESESDNSTASLFSYYTDLRNAEEWLLRLDYSSKASDRRSEQRARLEQVKQLLLAILPEGEVKDVRFAVGTGVNPVSRVEFSTPYGWVPLRQLGYGYQTLIAWMVDLASRMMERYPDSPNPLAEPAVVLVDEIDLHLHPTWQRQLIGHLTKNFLNTQFIATAHSPLVVQAAPADANIAVLRREGDHVVIDNDAKAVRGWRVDQVLTSDLFGLPTARPPQFDDLLKRRTELRSKGRLTAAEKRELTKVEEQIGDLPYGETAAQAEDMKLIKETLELLKKDQATKP